MFTWQRDRTAPASAERQGLNPVTRLPQDPEREAKNQRGEHERGEASSFPMEWGVKECDLGKGTRLTTAERRAWGGVLMCAVYTGKEGAG